MGFVNRLLGHPAAEDEPAVAPSSLMGVSGVRENVEIVERLPAPAFQASPDRIGGAVQGEYARFNEPEQVPWPGVYTIAEDGVTPEYYLEFDPVNSVFVYAELRNAR